MGDQGERLCQRRAAILPNLEGQHELLATPGDALQEDGLAGLLEQACRRLPEVAELQQVPRWLGQTTRVG